MTTVTVFRFSGGGLVISYRDIMNRNDKQEIVQSLERCFRELTFIVGSFIDDHSEPRGDNRQLQRLEDESSLLTVQEAADLLKVSRRAIYQWVSQGVIPIRRVGTLRRFSRRELIEWTRETDEGVRHPAKAKLGTTRSRTMRMLD